ncbi:hypothetical protein [Desulfogranum mediterraneum]|uniref:hypothetical protein n=1 Tax=Desulfogranum mediterraneum TaxID=160661 RepID=UPI000427BCFD|nr:hypothetical protein [Desulfogranum mediterraneum]
MKKYIGWMIVGTLLFYLLSVLSPALLTVATLLAYLVVLLSWRSLAKGALHQALLLVGSGLLAISFSASQGGFLGWTEIFAVNLPLLAMFVAVTFLTLTSQDREDPDLPSGKRAVAATALGTHLFGAVINLSVMFVFGDRLQKHGALSRAQLIVLGRSFSAAAWWSPFFIATGVALTYAPGMVWKETLIPGALMSGIALGYTIIEVCCWQKEPFAGYPLRVESLLVPLLLAAAVIVVHHFWHELNILLLICLLAPLGACLFMRGRPRLATLHRFIDTRIAAVNSQFALFLAAGVFSTGIKSITRLYPALFSLEGAVFSPLLFAGVLAGMIIIGIMGVHPIVSIAIVSPLLIPLQPDPSRLGFLFLSSWAITAGSSPLSGVGLALVSRYKASPRGILQSNWHYALVMWGGASLLNLLVFNH